MEALIGTISIGSQTNVNYFTKHSKLIAKLIFAKNFDENFNETYKLCLKFVFTYI